MTATETAIRALLAALAASPALPTPRRNASLDDVFDSFSALDGADAGRTLVLRDGAVKSAVWLGGNPPLWELTHGAEIEWIVCAPEGDDLHIAFDDGLAAIVAAIGVDFTLGGQVNSALITTPPERIDDQAGARPVKSAAITVDLLFTSTAPL